MTQYKSIAWIIELHSDLKKINVDDIVFNYEVNLDKCVGLRIDIEYDNKVFALIGALELDKEYLTKKYSHIWDHEDKTILYNPIIQEWADSYKKEVKQSKPETIIEKYKEPVLSYININEELY